MAEADVETGELRLDGPENERRQTLAEENPECRKCASLEQKRNRLEKNCQKRGMRISKQFTKQARMA